MTEETTPVSAARAEIKADPLAYSFEADLTDIEFLLQEIEAQIAVSNPP